MGSSPLRPLCREGSDPGPPAPGRYAVTLVLTTLGFTPLSCCRDWPGLQGVGLGVSSARPAWRFCLLTALANTLSRDSANYFWAAKRHSSYFSRSSMTLHFFGWLDRKPGTCSGSSRFAACKRQPRSVLAAPPRPSSVPPPPRPHCLGRQAAVAAGSGSEPTQRPPGCRWSRKPLPGYFWPLCWPVDSCQKQLLNFHLVLLTA